jgi:glucose/arabinose dehydrogenase
MSSSHRSLIFALGLVLTSAFASAQNMQAVRVTGGLIQPCGVAAAPGDTQRLFVIERTGAIRILINGVLQGPKLINLSSLLTSASYDQGLLGMAFHPDFQQNGFFFVNYTNSNGHSVVVRYRIPAGTPNLADPNSATVILGPIAQPQDDHNGGCLRFGPDGKLYVALGDGGWDPNIGGPNGQDLTTLLGKLLRLDVDLPAPHVPADNPFFGSATTRNEIWDFGLRHVWQFSFDAHTGDLYMGDVGEDSREELNIELAGSGGALNYGWRCLEGTLCTGYSGCSCTDPALVPPAFEYSHTTGCSITGGFVYRGCQIPALYGEYFFGDYCTGKIYSARFDRNTGQLGPIVDRTAQLAPGGGHAITRISAFGEDALGELYICDMQDGELYRIENLDPIVDCNANGAPDSCDIAGGGSLDVNGNSIPDECECTPPVTHCTPKVNSLGCSPTISSLGQASSSAASGFTVKALQVLNQKTGVLFYGVNGRTNTPFFGGTVCVAPPIARTRVTQSGGSPLGVNDCSGVFSIDMNAFARGALGGSPHPALSITGSTINCQWWGRDPGSTNPSQLSNALEYVVCP